MKTLGNILWFLVFGLLEGLSHLILGVCCFVTLVFIPFGVAHFRLAKLAFFPFGKTVQTNYEAHPAGNVIWLAFNGASLAVSYALLGGICCATIIGIPFGKQFFKLMKVSALPFGAEVN